MGMLLDGWLFYVVDSFEWVIYVFIFKLFKMEVILKDV